MNEARLIRRQELVVQLDYGQFYLSAADVDPEVVQKVVEQALEAGGIAQSDGVVVVESPLQNNFAMPLAVELWDAAPADDTTQWQEAFEAHLDVGDSGILYESPTIERIDLDVPPGSYHALITGARLQCDRLARLGRARRFLADQTVAVGRAAAPRTAAPIHPAADHASRAAIPRCGRRGGSPHSS